MIASAISSSEISSISPSTIITESAEAPIIMSISDAANCALFGLITNSPFTLATRASEIGHSKGKSLNCMAADAAKPANASGITSSS